MGLVTRLWYSLNADENIDAYVVLSMFPDQTQDNRAINELLHLAGIADKVLFVNRPMRFREVFVPEPSFRKGYYTDQYLEVIDTIRDRALKEPYAEADMPKKVFLSRSRFKKAQKGEGGLELLDSMFERNGFKIYYPETCSLTQMIQVMHSATVCASESGSIAFNTLFGSEHLQVIVVERIPLFANGNPVTNLSRAQRITYVDGCYIAYPPTVGGPCILGFTKELERFAADYSLRWPSLKYLTSIYRRKCFRIYENCYREKNVYQLWRQSDKLDWRPIVQEALLDTLEKFPWLSEAKITEMYYPQEGPDAVTLYDDARTTGESSA